MSKIYKKGEKSDDGDDETKNDGGGSDGDGNDGGNDGLE